MQDPEDARIACPRCRSNNFAGKTHCWQCGSPLPPPETVGRSAVIPPAATRGVHPRSQTPQRATRTTPVPNIQYQTPNTKHPSPQPDASPIHRYGSAFVPLLIGIGIAMFLVVWFVAGRMRPDADALRSGPRLETPVLAPAAPESPASRPAAEDTDPLVAESKRLIERESRHAGLPETPVSDDGRIHLRGGGSISPEQYNDAQRRIQGSPLMHPPLPPPPMP